MYALRPAAARGLTELAWLESHHSFSFGDYFDPRHMGVSVLRVINEDHVRPGAGFDTHGHRDMEILTYVTAGTIAHADSTGGRGEVPAGEFQLMHAGRGIRHSEFNASRTAPLSFLQVWLLPAAPGGEPGYEQRRLPAPRGAQLVASPDGRDGSLTLRQDACVWRVAGGGPLQLPLSPQRTGYVHMVRGQASVGGHALGAGDGLAISGEPRVEAVPGDDAEFLLFDLPPVAAREN